MASTSAQSETFKLWKKAESSIRNTNNVVTGKLDIDHVDVSELARRDPAAVFVYTFGAVTYRLRSPKSMCSIYPTGVMTCMGSKSSVQAYRAIYKNVNLLNHRGIKCRLIDLKFDNVVSSITTFPVDLDLLLSIVGTPTVNYVTDKTSPLHFPAASLNCALIPAIVPRTRIVFLIFLTGMINVTGAESIEETLRVFKYVFFNFLQHIRIKSDTILHSNAKRAKVDINEDGEQDDDDFTRDETAFMKAFHAIHEIDKLVGSQM